ncbi:MAG: hypothetical protein AABW49_01195 [Nanoarchaeota archaeon]
MEELITPFLMRIPVDRDTQDILDRLFNIYGDININTLVGTLRKRFKFNPTAILSREGFQDIVLARGRYRSRLVSEDVHYYPIHGVYIKKDDRFIYTSKPD